MVVLQKLLDLTSVTLRLRRTLLDLQQYDLSGKVTQTENYSSHMLSSCSIMPLTSGLHGTGRWMAYEQLFLDGRISTPYTFKTDIWSFGMTILVSLTIISFLFLTNNTFPNTKELLTLKVLYAHLTDTLVTIAIYKKELPPPGDLRLIIRNGRKNASVCGLFVNLVGTSTPGKDQIHKQSYMNLMASKWGPLCTIWWTLYSDNFCIA